MENWYERRFIIESTKLFSSPQKCSLSIHREPRNHALYP